MGLFIGAHMLISCATCIAISNAQRGEIPIIPGSTALVDLLNVVLHQLPMLMSIELQGLLFPGFFFALLFLSSVSNVTMKKTTPSSLII